MVQQSPGPSRPVAGLLDLEQRHSGRDFSELRSRIFGGAPEAWNEFVGRYSKTVYAFALRLAGRRPDREDTAQQVYLEVFERLSADGFRVLRTFRGDCRFETYLFTMVRHEVGRLRRRDRRHGARLVDYEESPGSSKGEDESFTEAVGLDPGKVLEIVSRSLESLDPQERLVLRLRFGEGLSLRRLSETFGWKDTNAAAYEVCKILRKLDVVGRCRRTLRWGEPERNVLQRFLRRWLDPGSPSGTGGRNR